MNKTKKWDLRFLNLAKNVSTWSKDPSTQVGAVISDKDNLLVNVGYNGHPQGIEDTKERYENRAWKLKHVLHAEQNAIMLADRNFFTGCSLYVYPLYPCTTCCSIIIQSRFDRVVGVENDRPEWGGETSKLYEESRIEFGHYSSLEASAEYKRIA